MRRLLIGLGLVLAGFGVSVSTTEAQLVLATCEQICCSGQAAVGTRCLTSFGYWTRCGSGAYFCPASPLPEEP